MGELIILSDVKKARQAAEDQKLSDEIARLQADLKEMIKEMGDPEIGPYLYEETWLEFLPHLQTIDGLLDGYADCWKDMQD